MNSSREDRAANQESSSIGDSPVPAFLGGSDAQFNTTHWSRIIAAGATPSIASRDALEQLCRSYWYPLYAFARKSGQSHADAQDLVQSFFAKLLENNAIALATPERGRFRTFLLNSLQNYMRDAWRSSQRLKRGGGHQIHSLGIDFETGEQRFEAEAGVEETPDRIFERQWATGLLEATLRDLEKQYTERGKGKQFELLRPFITSVAEPRQGYESMAKEVGMTVGALRVSIFRIRERFRDQLRTLIAQTVASPDDIQEEILDLFKAFGS